MRKSLYLLFASAIMFLAVSLPASGQVGPYIGGGVIYNNPLSDVDYLDPALGLHVKFGYDFGPVSVEGSLMGSEHDDDTPGFADDADFSAFSLDFRFFVSPPADPNQIYFLAGVGFYSLDQFDPRFGAETTMDGEGWNLGTGLEHFLNPNLALNFGFVYRFIRYDEVEIDGADFSLSPDIKGNTWSLETGVTYYF